MKKSNNGMLSMSALSALALSFSPLSSTDATGNQVGPVAMETGSRINKVSQKKLRQHARRQGKTVNQLKGRR